MFYSFPSSDTDIYYDFLLKATLNSSFCSTVNVFHWVSAYIFSINFSLIRWLIEISYIYPRYEILSSGSLVDLKQITPNDYKMTFIPDIKIVW